MNQTTLFPLAAALLMLGRASVLMGAGPPPPAEPPGPWVTRSWQGEDGLPGSSVTALLQTRDGFLWAGLSAGLVRFDGLHFRRFGLRDGLRSIYITALAEDRQGVLWAGTSGGGLSRHEKGRFTSFGPEEGFPTASDVISLAADRDGSLWIGTGEGLVHGNHGAFRLMGEAEGLPRKQIRALAQDAQGVLWVSVIEDGLYRGANGRFARVEEKGPPGGSIYCLLAARDGTLWAGSHRLWKRSGETWQGFDKTSGLPSALVHSLAEDKKGTLWVGTRNNGLYRQSGGRFLPAAGDGLLADKSVFALAGDREGSVWAGLVGGGLHRLSPRLLHDWPFRDAGKTATVTSLASRADGYMLAATAGRGVRRFNSGQYERIPDSPLSDDNAVVYCTTVTSDGSLWAAGEQSVVRFQPGQPPKAYSDPPIRGEALRALCADGEALWIGTYYSTLLKLEAGAVRVVAPAGSFRGGITSIAREAADTLWIASSGGLHRWERGQIRSWTTREGLPANHIRTLHRDADGTLWLGTLGGGLACMRQEKFFHITTRQGLADDVISQILADDHDCLWLGSNRGIMRLERRDLEALMAGQISEVHPIVLGRNEGMHHEQCNGGTSPTAFKAPDGRLFFPASNGVAEIDPRQFLNLNTAVPEVIIDKILLDQVPQHPDKALIIPPGHHRLEIACSAPALRGGEWLRFRHKLEGMDQGWNPGGRSRVIIYDGLPPGGYVLRVSAASSLGDRHGPGTTLAFTVQPFIWQTLWFRIGAAVFLVFSSSGIAWWYARRRHLRHLAEREREQKQQAELVHLSRVSSLGQLSGSLAHELNQPLAIILSNAEAAEQILATDTPDIGELKEIIHDIIGENQRAGEVIQSLRSLLKRDETRLMPLSLNEVAASVLRLMRKDLDARGVSVQTGFEEPLPAVQGDRVQLQQVILNLILNACDAMEGSPPEQRELRIQTRRHGHAVRLSVHDKGCGLPEADPNLVFKSFYTTKAKGLGLGLSICRSIIASHHGRIWGEPDKERGTVFHIELQAADSSIS